MNTQYLKSISLTIIILFLLGIVVWRKHRNLNALSPKEIVSTYYKAKEDGDIELLQQIIYFPPGTSEMQKKSKARSALSGADEKGMMRIVGAKLKAEYQRNLTDNLAEVGVIINVGLPGFKKRIPFEQIILKHNGEMWKYHYSKWELTEDQLIEDIRNNPLEASGYYHMGTLIQSENPTKAHRFYKKYYEMERNGFWVTEDFLEKVNMYENTDDFEDDLLKKLPDAPPGNRSDVFLILGQYFLEFENFDKASLYFQKTEEVIREYPGPLVEERLAKAKRELKLRREGKYIDLLDELEKKE
ncbi:hypothetical protein KAR91_38540 [Candidatus Pacearchaeota archaeon]|nr:hypothetical protein [Candidatus Pacearchaeota archaeon]